MIPVAILLVITNGIGIGHADAFFLTFKSRVIGSHRDGLHTRSKPQVRVRVRVSSRVSA